MSLHSHGHGRLHVRIHGVGLDIGVHVPDGVPGRPGLRVAAVEDVDGHPGAARWVDGASEEAAVVGATRGAVQVDPHRHAVGDGSPARRPPRSVGHHLRDEKEAVLEHTEDGVDVTAEVSYCLPVAGRPRPPGPAAWRRTASRRAEACRGPDPGGRAAARCRGTAAGPPSGPACRGRTRPAPACCPCRRPPEQGEKMLSFEWRKLWRFACMLARSACGPEGRQSRRAQLRGGIAYPGLDRRPWGPQRAAEVRIRAGSGKPTTMLQNAVGYCTGGFRWRQPRDSSSLL